MSATWVFEMPLTSPSTTFAPPATVAAGRRRHNKQRQSRKPVTKRSIDWKMVDSVFEHLHARFDFTLEGCADDEGLNSHGDLPHCSPSDSILERDLSVERVFIHPTWELVEHVGQHFKSCRRTTPTPTMDVLFYLSEQTSTSSLATGNSTKNSHPGRSGGGPGGGCARRPVGTYLYLHPVGGGNPIAVPCLAR
jgi:hypothetical protein